MEVRIGLKVAQSRMLEEAGASVTRAVERMNLMVEMAIAASGVANARLNRVEPGVMIVDVPDPETE